MLLIFVRKEERNCHKRLSSPTTSPKLSKKIPTLVLNQLNKSLQRDSAGSMFFLKALLGIHKVQQGFRIMAGKNLEQAKKKKTVVEGIWRGSKRKKKATNYEIRRCGEVGVRNTLV